MNLAEFAAANPPKIGSKCWLCGIPERSEVEAAYRSGVGMSTICAWLAQERGYKDATRHRVVNHLKTHLGE